MLVSVSTFHAYTVAKRERLETFPRSGSMSRQSHVQSCHTIPLLPSRNCSDWASAKQNCWPKSRQSANIQQRIKSVISLPQKFNLNILNMDYWINTNSQKNLFTQFYFSALVPTAQINQTLGESEQSSWAQPLNTAPTTEEVSSGLKEASSTASQRRWFGFITDV